MNARVLVVQHEDGAPLGRFSTIRDLALDVVRPDKGDPVPTAAGGYQGLVVLGGSMAAWDDGTAPWLPATRALLVACVADRTPTLGICLGAQLLASSERYPHQLFRLGDVAWGVQYHPEVERADFGDWMHADERLLEDAGLSRREVMARFDALEQELTGSAARHAAAFADVVLGGARRP